ATAIDRLAATAQVGLAYGEPINVGDRVIIPVGAVGYGFGAGFGSGGGRQGRGRRGGGAGGGGGGGLSVTPIALVEITKKGTRVRPVLDGTRIAVMAVAILVPMLLRRRFRQRVEDVEQLRLPGEHVRAA